MSASSTPLNSFVNTVAKRISDVIGTQAKNSVKASTAVKEMMKEIVSSAETLNKAGPILEGLTIKLEEAGRQKAELDGRLRGLEATKMQADAKVNEFKSELTAIETQAKEDADAAADAERLASEAAAKEETRKKEQAALQRESILEGIRKQITQAEEAVAAAKNEADSVSTQVATLDNTIMELTSKAGEANKAMENAGAAKKLLDEKLKKAAQDANAEATILANQTADGAKTKLANSVGLLNPNNVNQLNTKLQGLQPQVNAAFQKMKQDGLAALQQANQRATAAISNARAAVEQVSAAATAASGQQGGRRKLRTRRTRVLRKRTRKHR